MSENPKDTYSVEPTRLSDGFGVVKDGWAVVDRNGKEVASFHVRSQAERHREFKEHCAKPLR